MSSGTIRKTRELDEPMVGEPILLCYNSYSYPSDPLSPSGRAYCVQSIRRSSLQLSSFGISP